MKVEAKIRDVNIYLVPVGIIDNKIIEELEVELSKSLPLPRKIKIASSKRIPESAYNSSRNQYRASLILKDLSKKIVINPENERSIFIVDVDLYEEGLNFVFGLAEPNTGMCIISLARLRNEFYGLKPNEKLFLNRVLKEAVHELGHTFGLFHCSNPECAMYFSNSLPDTDRKDSAFCPICSKRFR